MKNVTNCVELNLIYEAVVAALIREKKSSANWISLDSRGVMNRCIVDFDSASVGCFFLLGGVVPESVLLVFYRTLKDIARPA